MAWNPNMVILSQMSAAVKRENAQIWQLLQAYQVYRHTIHKKGCDDPYGNGQGRYVRQDHA